MLPGRSIPGTVCDTFQHSFIILWLRQLSEALGNARALPLHTLDCIPNVATSNGLPEIVTTSEPPLSIPVFGDTNCGCSWLGLEPGLR